MPELTIIETNVATLMPYTQNPRTHSKKQIRQIATSIKEFGFTNPILVDGTRLEQPNDACLPLQVKAL